MYDHNIRNYGAVGDGKTNDAHAIQSACDSALDVGGVVWCPPGQYCIDEPVVVREGLILAGAGWGGTSVGTWFVIRKPGFSPIRVLAGDVTIRDLAFKHAQPTNFGSSWEPLEGFEWTIDSYNDDLKLQRVHMLNPTYGVRARGRFWIDGFSGQPLKRGIYALNTSSNDVQHISDVHLWSFWEPKSDHVANYTRANCYGLILEGCDNPLVSGVFVQRCNVGIYVSGDRGTSRFHIQNVDLDNCFRGVFIDTKASGQIANLIASGGSGSSEVGIRADSTIRQNGGIEVQFCNTDLGHWGNNAVLAAGPNTFLYFQNLTLGDWNKNGGSFPAIEAKHGARVQVDMSGIGFNGNEGRTPPMNTRFGTSNGGEITSNRGSYLPREICSL